MDSIVSSIANFDGLPVQTQARTVFMFSGQGSHYFEMGKELYESEAVFRQWLTYLDNLAVAYRSPPILKMLYFSGKTRGATFNDIRYTHPALYIVQYALAQTLIEKGIRPDIVFGSSLGEVVAAAVAGAISVESGLRLVMEQAALFRLRVNNGAMLAVLADEKLFQSIPTMQTRSDIAAYNAERHFVVSGTQDNILHIEQQLKAQGHNSQMLDVNTAFHSRELDSVHKEFCEIMVKYRWAEPKLPLVSCAYRGILSVLPADYFWKVLRTPIHFSTTFRQLLECGKFSFIDIGPSATLHTLSKQFLGEGDIAFPGMSMFGRDQQLLETIVAHFSKTASVATV